MRAVNIHFERGWLAIEEVGDEHFVVLMVVGDGQDVGALERLVLVAKDVVDVDDALGSVIGTGGV